MDGGYPPYTVATFSCFDFYFQTGSTSSICRPSGDWNLDAPICTPSKGNNILSLFHFIFIFPEFIDKTRFSLIFVVITCPHLSLANGGITYSISPLNGRYRVHTVASFTCNSGYSISGSSTRTCQMSGNWDQQTPICNESNNIS